MTTYSAIGALWVINVCTRNVSWGFKNKFYFILFFILKKNFCYRRDRGEEDKVSNSFAWEMPSYGLQDQERFQFSMQNAKKGLGHPKSNIGSSVMKKSNAIKSVPNLARKPAKWISLIIPTRSLEVAATIIAAGVWRNFLFLSGFIQSTEWKLSEYVFRFACSLKRGKNISINIRICKRRRSTYVWRKGGSDSFLGTPVHAG